MPTAALTLLPPLGFENTFAILVRGDDARRLGLRTIEDAAPRHAVAGRPASATNSCSAPTAIRACRRSTGCVSPAPPTAMDLSLIYRALAAAAGRPDRRRRDQRPDRGLRPGHAAGQPALLSRPTTRSRSRAAATLLRHPEVRAALEALAGRITIDDMRRMNHAVDAERQDPAGRGRAISSRGLNGTPCRVRDDQRMVSQNSFNTRDVADRRRPALPVFQPSRAREGRLCRAGAAAILAEDPAREPAAPRGRPVRRSATTSRRSPAGT